MKGGSKYIKLNAKEPIEIQVFNDAEQLLKGLTDLYVRIRRHADDLYFDWNDATFKAPATVIQMEQVLEEVSPTYSPGIYRLNRTIAPMHVKGFDTSIITNPGSGDVYDITIVQIGGTDAAGLPTGYELHVDPTILTLTEIADAVWDETKSGHTTPGSFGEEVQTHATPTEVQASALAALNTYDPPTKAELDTTEDNIRGTDSDTLKTISDQLDTKPTAAQIDTQLSGTHGAGAWDGTESDWTSTEREELRAALGIVGDKSGPSGGGQLQEILADTADIQPKIDTPISSRAAPGAEMDLITDAVDANAFATSARDEIVNEVTNQLSSAHGSGSWEGATVDAIADQVWDEPKVDHTTLGSFGEEIQEHATPTEVKAKADQALVDYDPPTKAELDIATNSIRGSDADDLKVLSDQLDDLPTIINTLLSGVHGSGSWESSAISPTIIANAVWNAMQADHTLSGSFGDAVQRIVALQKENYYIDQMAYNTQGLMLSGRIRLFRTKTDALGATDGGAGEGEFATYTFTTTETLGEPCKARTARSVRDA
ncbi:MAG: hypothetical protein PVI90_00185 [Desulfobacteraceae bacterium]|jgi:hypothetical protein